MMTGLLDELWPGGRGRHVVDGGLRGLAGSTLRDIGLESGARPLALIAMPFDEAYEDAFYFGIEPSTSAATATMRYHSIRDLERQLARELDGLLRPTGPLAASRSSGPHHAQ